MSTMQIPECCHATQLYVSFNSGRNQIDLELLVWKAADGHWPWASCTSISVVHLLHDRLDQNGNTIAVQAVN